PGALPRDQAVPRPVRRAALRPLLHPCPRRAEQRLRNGEGRQPPAGTPAHQRGGSQPLPAHEHDRKDPARKTRPIRRQARYQSRPVRPETFHLRPGRLIKRPGSMHSKENMNLQYLNWKIFLENPAETEPEEYFKVLNTWLPDSPEVFLDVADYNHVTDGPVMVLVGHYLNFPLDRNGRRLGLLLDYKQPMDGDNADKLRITLRDLLLAARRLEGEALFSHKPSFRTSELQLIVN